MSPIIKVGDVVYFPDGNQKMEDGTRIPTVVEGVFRRMQGCWCVISNSGRELVVSPRIVFKTREGAAFYADTSPDMKGASNAIFATAETKGGRSAR